jgi:hypothetical protein
MKDGLSVIVNSTGGTRASHALIPLHDRQAYHESVSLEIAAANTHVSCTAARSLRDCIALEHPLVSIGQSARWAYMQQ